MKIQSYLIRNKIKFIEDKTFPDLKYKNKLRCDIYLPQYNSIIEYDGNQHFRYTPKFHFKYERYETSIIRDQIKNKYAKDNKIHLLRISGSYLSDEELHQVLDYWISQVRTTRSWLFMVKGNIYKSFYMEHGIYKTGSCKGMIMKHVSGDIKNLFQVIV